MTIHFFTKGDLASATARYRGFLVASELNSRGYKTVIHQPPTWRPFFKINAARLKELIRHGKILFSLKRGDVIYLVRTVYQYDFLWLIVFFKIFFRRKFIFDFDDPIFLRRGFKFKMLILTKLADAVIVGSHYLAEWAERYNRNIFIIPTSVPFDLYAKNSRVYRAGAQDKLIMGWVGNAPAHYDNLQILAPVFQKLIKGGARFKFVLVGALKNDKVYQLFRTIDGLEAVLVDTLDWRDPENIAREIKQFDLGLMPLIDNQWNRGKCAFKAIEYMACGVAPLVSAVGENVYLIQDGENGFLAKISQDWVEKINNLSDNKELLPLIGRRAQLTIKNQYSFSANISKIIKIIKGI